MIFCIHIYNMAASFHPIAKNPTHFREKFRAKLAEIYQLSLKDATNMEISVYNYSLQEANVLKIVKKWENRHFVQIYMDRLRSIYINLKNPAFREKIASQEIQAQQVGFLTHPEMNPERWRVLMERKMKRDLCNNNTTINASTDMFTCRKCHSKKCVYYELQTRSADEPSTIFVTCLTCGKNWKQ